MNAVRRTFYVPDDIDHFAFEDDRKEIELFLPVYDGVAVPVEGLQDYVISVSYELAAYGADFRSIYYNDVFGGRFVISSDNDNITGFYVR